MAGCRLEDGASPPVVCGRLEGSGEDEGPGGLLPAAGGHLLRQDQ